MKTDPVYIVAAQRTPIGNFQGCFQSLSATELGSAAIKGVIDKAGINADDLESVIMGCVLPAGLGQAPARQASRGAGVPDHVGCTTLNKVCGSSMKALMFATDTLRAGSTDMILAGGMESMTNAPYLLPKARSGYRLGHQRAIDHLFYDGLEDAYEHQLMGHYAELCAKKYQYTREDQDAFALRSVERARLASEQGWFNDEIIPVTVKDQNITKDEGPLTARPEKIPLLKPAFSAEGTVTAANSSSISDGAAALILATEARVKALNLKPIAKIIAHSTHSQEPAWFTTAPIGAIEKCLQKASWRLSEVDLFEINEAFAVVTLATMESLKLDPARVNIHGGACVLGHPIGASGARIVVTLIHALRKEKAQRGIAGLCIGGGEATAIAVELLSD